MTRQELINEIKAKRSFLCVGLDVSLDKLPPHLPKTPLGVLQFSKAIIDATLPYAVAYKPNLAFYEAMGAEGLQVLAETLTYIPKNVFTIADAKRGDIGNTGNQYAEAFFNTLGVDSITLSPYMGQDSISPFLTTPGKWAIVLALTSNPGAANFQLQNLANGQPLYKHVLQTVASWGTPANTMFVVGATRPEYFTEVRSIVPNHFLLVPGVGAQGGSLTDVCLQGLNNDIGLLINSSRAILFADSSPNFAHYAAQEAQRMQTQMEAILIERELISVP